MSLTPRQRSDPRGSGLEERLRAEYIKGAEEEWPRRLGRRLTPQALERVLRRFPRPHG
jgi:hypothetical protein